MTRAERETVIIGNLADLDEGFFRVETTEKNTFARLRRMAGPRLKVTESKNSGKVVAWICEVPVECWTGLGAKAKRKMTPEAKAALSERGKAILAKARMAKMGKISA